VTTQDPVRQQALIVPDKAERVHQFHQNTLKALKEMVQAAGLLHPNEITAHHIVRRVNETGVKLLVTIMPPLPLNALLDRDISGLPNVFKFYWPHASADSFKLQME
jgi:hypothetical protein